MSNNILVVGCGGIGCEVIKLLYLNKQKNLTIIDYDYIELTNLNRQFLFDKYDIKKSKANVSFNKFKFKHPTSNIKVLTKNIMEYDYLFFKNFDVVYNCLDNFEARQFVNQRCILANVPLVDGGSAGFYGQAMVFMKGGECFDCYHTEKQTEYPVCTIRSFPTKYEHCVIWTKNYFFTKISEYKTITLNLSEYDKYLKKEIENRDEKFLEEDNLSLDFIETQNTTTLESKDYHTIVFDNNEDIFVNKKRLKRTQERDIRISILEGIIEINKSRDFNFDKDNRIMMKLIHNISCLRAKAFNISPQSLLETENIAGNIIPSVCTTNSIVASLMLHIGENIDRLKSVFYYYLVKNKIISKIEGGSSNSECNTCQNSFYILEKNKSYKIKDLITDLNGILDEDLVIFYDNYLIYEKSFEFDKNDILNVENNKFITVKDKKGNKIKIYILEKENNRLAKI